MKRRGWPVAGVVLAVSPAFGQSPEALRLAYNTSTLCAAVALVDENMVAYRKAQKAQRLMGAKLGYAVTRANKDIAENLTGLHSLKAKGDETPERSRATCRRLGFLS